MLLSFSFVLLLRTGARWEPFPINITNEVNLFVFSINFFYNFNNITIQKVIWELVHWLGVEVVWLQALIYTFIYSKYFDLMRISVLN